MAVRFRMSCSGVAKSVQRDALGFDNGAVPKIIDDGVTNFSCGACVPRSHAPLSSSLLLSGGVERRCGTRTCDAAGFGELAFPVYRKEPVGKCREDSDSYDERQITPAISGRRFRRHVGSRRFTWISHWASPEKRAHPENVELKLTFLDRRLPILGSWANQKTCS
jgi:hypothetical protein